MSARSRTLALHGAVVAAILALHFILPDYHHGILARTMVLAVYAMAYNVMFGYTGLLSLGHALFFAAGMYGMGLSSIHLGFSPGPAIVCGVAAAFAVSLIVGILALRTSGVALMIVTLMFAQAGWYLVLYFGEYTRGDEGFVIPRAARMLAGFDLADASNRYIAALVLFAFGLVVTLKAVESRFGRVLVAIRENEERARMLGYDVFRYKLGAVVLSGTLSGLAGACYGILFGYVGATFASVQYSILPLLWVLLGGASTVLGPFVGTYFMTYLIDISSAYTTAYMLVAGVVLVVLTLFARQGIMGEVRRRLIPWLP